MYILFGVSNRKKNLGQQSQYCLKCQRETVHSVEKRKTWFTLFFIPVIPLSGTQAVARCNLCGKETILRQVPDAQTLSKPGPAVVLPSPGKSLTGTSPSTETTTKKTKKCPKCAEEILLEAMVCRFCGHQFPEDEVQAAVRTAEEEAQATRELARQRALEAEQTAQEKAAQDKLDAKEKRGKAWSVISLIVGVQLLLAGICTGIMFTAYAFSDEAATAMESGGPVAVIVPIVCIPLPLLLIGGLLLFIGIRSIRLAQKAAKNASADVIPK